jgi:hypothetical protein
MADVDTAQPVRSYQDATDERVLVKLQDGADPGGSEKTMEISEFLAHIRKFANDSDGAKIQELLSQEGHSLTNGAYDATNNKRPSSNAKILHDRVAAPSEADQNFRPTGVSSSDGDEAHAADVAIRDSQGNKLDENNPLAVFVTEDPGDEIEDFDAAAAVAKDGTSNHDYTVAATTELRALNVEASSSGYAKYELQVETSAGSGTFNTVGVKFGTASQPNVEFKLKKPKAVVTGAIVRLIKTNLENQAQDLYSTINGVAV